MHKISPSDIQIIQLYSEKEETGAYAPTEQLIIFKKEKFVLPTSRNITSGEYVFNESMYSLLIQLYNNKKYDYHPVSPEEYLGLLHPQQNCI